MGICWQQQLSQRYSSPSLPLGSAVVGSQVHKEHSLWQNRAYQPPAPSERPPSRFQSPVILKVDPSIEIGDDADRGELG